MSTTGIGPELMAATHRTTAGTSAIARHSVEHFDRSITWADLDWLLERTRLPVVLKGILTPEDAELAVAHGAAGIVGSNHGGRQLDHALPTADALPAIADTVAGRCTVLVDGEVRSGTDVLKLLALGADAALVGRPALWGLAAHGYDGVHGLLSLLHEELTEAMLLSGRPTVKSLDHTLLDHDPAPCRCRAGSPGH
ncbi:alpha-hydroxy acid oxidase [Kitasatospora sp. NPDC018058]|uniref:alpha-hydroxy acid oxidase n=1 Tax=Kitasatospora sp. NPDC018058 TaxID=3364025 RepID=UPI0037C0D312